VRGRGRKREREREREKGRGGGGAERERFKLTGDFFKKSALLSKLLFAFKLLFCLL
jgi:hypothetical protein